MHLLSTQYWTNAMTQTATHTETRDGATALVVLRIGRVLYAAHNGPQGESTWSELLIACGLCV
jgi:hypothetical protein